MSISVEVVEVSGIYREVERDLSTPAQFLSAVMQIKRCP